MKIRSGFVSNSSASSFCIYGTHIEDSLLEKIKKEINFNEEEDDLYEALEEILLKHGIDLYRHSDGDIFYIGTSWKYVKDEETGKQFKDRVEKAISEFVGKTVKCQTHEEAWG